MSNDDRFEHEVSSQLSLLDLVFLAFNSRVAALDRETGEVVWNWKSPKGTSSHVALLLDGDRLIVSIQGYTYCLDPYSGAQLWFNPLKGYGYGVPSLASLAGNSGSAAAAAIIAQRRAANSAAANS